MHNVGHNEEQVHNEELGVFTKSRIGTELQLVLLPAGIIAAMALTKHSDDEMNFALRAWGSRLKAKDRAAKLERGEPTEDPPLVVPARMIRRAWQLCPDHRLMPEHLSLEAMSLTQLVCPSQIPFQALGLTCFEPSLDSYTRAAGFFFIQFIL